MNQMGIPKELVIAILITSRSSGMITHAIEQRDIGKILFIHQNYIG